MKIVCVTLLIALLISMFLFGSKYKMMFLFHGIWSTVLLLHYINLCSYNPVSDKAYVLVLIGTLAFDFGYIIKEHICFAYGGGGKINSHKTDMIESINISLLILLMIIHMVLSIYNAYHAKQLLDTGFLYNQMRQIFQGYIETDFRTHSLLVTYTYFSAPLMYAITCVVINSFFKEKKLKWYYYVIYCLDLLCYFFYTSGRSMIFFALVLLVFYLIFYKSNISYELKRKIVCLAIFLLVIVLLVTIYIFSNVNFTMFRGRFGLGSLYVYGSGPISLLDIYIKEVDKSDIQTFGLVFLNPIHQTLNAILGFLGFGKTDLYMSIEELLNYKETFHRIAPNVNLNAYGTLFYDFYLDFREMGVFLGCFLYGVMSNVIEWKLYRKASEKDMLIGGMYLFSFVQCICRWNFYTIVYCLSFVYILLLCIPIRIRLYNDKVCKHI